MTSSKLLTPSQTAKAISDSFKKGGVITDPRGQWAHPGKITRIPSNQITMKGVPYNVLGISDTGDTQMMYPGQDYFFDGSAVTEFPMMPKAQLGIETFPFQRKPKVIQDGMKYVGAPIDTLHIKDSRKIRATTGKPMVATRDLLSGNYDTTAQLNDLMNKAKNAGLNREDTTNMLAMALAETQFGRTDDNLGHVLDPNEQEGENLNDVFVRAYKEKQALANSKKITNPALRLQVYNGLGKVFPNTEKDYHGFEMKSIYGVPLTSSGIDMSKNPLYGKNVIDVRDNVLLKNKDVIDYIDLYYKKNGGQKDQSIVCGNCGWSWKESNAGSQPTKCHKCNTESGQVMMKEGGWLNQYNVGGVTEEDPELLNRLLRNTQPQFIGRGVVKSREVDQAERYKKQVALTKKQAEEFKQRKLQAAVERKQRIELSAKKQEVPFFSKERWKPENIAQETEAIGDKLSLQNLPFVGEYIPDFLDATGAVGSMASGLGRIPLNIQQGNYGQAAMAVATPLAVGALAGLGTQNTGQFVNNLANPLAGTGQMFNNAGRFLTEKTALKNAFKKYKQVNFPTSSAAPASNFKSEINWENWNKRIPENTQLMNEYNSIERTTKADGSWMKYSDGSNFNGTPEQFIQMKHPNTQKYAGGVKEAEQMYKEPLYRGAHQHIVDFKNRDRNDYATFLTSNEKNAETYAGSDGGIKKFFHPDIDKEVEAYGKFYPLDGKGKYQLSFPQNLQKVVGNAEGRKWRLLNYDESIAKKLDAKKWDGSMFNHADDHNEFLKSTYEKESDLESYGLTDYNPLNKYLSTDNYASYVKNKNNPEGIAQIRNVKDQMGFSKDIPANDVFAIDAERIPIKSLRYNDGMFDVTNPNIYKAAVPVVGAGVLASQDKMKNGGQHGGLDRWFAEKWVDVKTGKACGRQKGESRAGYPACRPSKRISAATPKTASELSSAEKARFKREKTSSKRIDYNHKKQMGGMILNETMENPYEMKKGGNVPTNPALWSRAKAAARAKYDVYPSAYANGWAAKWYKGKGGGWRKAEYGMEVMGNGGTPDNPGFNALPEFVQEKIMANMAYGGTNNPGFQALPEFVQAKILSNMAYGGYIPEMGMGGIPCYECGGMYENGGELEMMREGGIPDRYRNKGFTKVGAKRNSTRPGKKWMVLAKKGDNYKVVHGGYDGMKDFTQHGSENRKERFWDRMGGRNSAKAKDPFSPLYWHKRFGTWKEGGQVNWLENYDLTKAADGLQTENPAGFVMSNTNNLINTSAKTPVNVINTVPVKPVVNNNTSQYKVQSGDTLGKIAKQYGVSVKKIAAANNLANPDKISVNQSLIIPSTSSPTYKQEYQNWNDLKKRTDYINTLADEQLISEYYTNRPEETYMVVDKKNARMNYYKGNKLVKSYEVGVGANPGDAQTVTKVKDGKTDWSAGNMSTGAGVYTISNIDPKSKAYYGLPAFNLKNDQGIEVATTIHGTPTSRRSRFNNNNVLDNRMSSGCINGKCFDLQDMYQYLDVGTPIYILPEDEGNRFQLVDGKPVLRVNAKNRVKYNEYTDQQGRKQKGQGVNQSINTLNYKPIKAVFNENDFKNNVFTAFDFNDENELNTSTKPFVSALVNNKQKIMQAAQIPGDVYNEIAKMSFGIYGTESNYGDTHSAAGNLSRAVAKAFDRKSSSSPDYESKYNTYGADENVNSVGYTQIRWSQLDDQERKVLQKLGITSNKDLLNPEKAAIATTAILGVRYNQQLTSEQKKDLWKHLPKKWNVRGNYSDRVKQNARFLNFKQLDNKMNAGGWLENYN